MARNLFVLSALDKREKKKDYFPFGFYSVGFSVSKPHPNAFCFPDFSRLYYGCFSLFCFVVFSFTLPANIWMGFHCYFTIWILLCFWCLEYTLSMCQSIQCVCECGRTCRSQLVQQFKKMFVSVNIKLEISSNGLPS